ncbi:hypothetical protein BN1080_00668 [Planococcus massiliensis]|uniref:DUF4097 domain-containing protein n=1 Tax=Planococcus massiliensis TaxID=1499687 RepID=A0A098EIW6_9BACL|nr:DUF4097 family beta strand repeat-containing protein [Planococcus massiliensis]CEG21752.1 hypothetical protein BN1080_00668 [Planococcus massiliensis]
MTEHQFLLELEAVLHQLPAEERQDISQDIREYFLNGRRDGKQDEEIAAELGAPAAIAQELLASFDFSQVEAKPKAVNLSKDEFDKVDIQIDNGTLDIGLSQDGKMHVDVEDKGYNQQLFVDVLDRTLVITLKEEAKKWGIFSFAINTKSPRVRIQLPSKIYDSLKIVTDNGRIDGADLESSVLTAKSDNGGICFEDLKTAELRIRSDNGALKLKSSRTEKAEMKSDNGKIELENIEAAQIRLQSDNGSILMDRVEGRISAESDNGRIRLFTSNLERDITLKTDNGSITVETAEEPTNASIHAHKDYGKAKIFGVKSNHTVYGSGQHSIILKTDNGSIEVKKS